MKIFRTHFLNRAIRSYIHKLGPSLLKRYGFREQYTVLQVSKTIRALKLDQKYLAYAVALYRQSESKNSMELFSLNQQLIDKLRSEIGNAIFSGNDKYTVQDVLRLTRSRGWQGGPAPDWKIQMTGRTNL